MKTKQPSPARRKAADFVRRILEVVTDAQEPLDLAGVLLVLGRVGVAQAQIVAGIGEHAPRVVDRPAELDARAETPVELLFLLGLESAVARSQETGNRRRLVGEFEVRQSQRA